MKRPMIASVDVALYDTLKERAYKERKSFSALVNELLMAASTPGSVVASSAVTPPKLSTKASLVLAAVEQLSKAAEKLPENDIRHFAREYRIDEVCKKVGLFPSSARPALRECERAGVLVCSTIHPVGMGPDALWVDHWRLPKTSR